MPTIVRTNDLFGLHADFLREVYRLQSLWDDRQYQYFLSHYAEPLAADLKEMEDDVRYYLQRIFIKQCELESL